MKPHFSIPALKQSGVTAMGMLVLCVLLGFWVLVIIKLTPIYMEASSVRAIFKQYEEEANTIGTKKKDVVNYFGRFFNVNDIRNVPLDNIVLEAKKKETIVSLTYEVPVPFVTTGKYGDVLILLKFHNQVIIPKGKKTKQ